MEQLLLILHVLFASCLIGLVLLQRGKGAQMGAAFGSGASQTIFGSRGSIGFLVKVTVLFAALFFASSIALTYLASHTAKTPADSELMRSIDNLNQMEQAVKPLKQTTVEPMPVPKSTKNINTQSSITKK